MSLGVAALSERKIWRAVRLCHFCRIDILYTHYHRYFQAEEDKAVFTEAVQGFWLSCAADGIYCPGQLYLSAAAGVQAKVYMARPRYRAAGYSPLLFPSGQDHLQPPPTLRYRLTAL